MFYTVAFDFMTGKLYNKEKDGGGTVMKKPIIAIMYDFDKTLCTRDMQEYTKEQGNTCKSRRPNI